MRRYKYRENSGTMLQHGVTDKTGNVDIDFFHPAFNPTQVLRTVTDHATPRRHPTPACPVQVVVTMGTQVPEVVAD